MKYLAFITLFFTATSWATELPKTLTYSDAQKVAPNSWIAGSSDTFYCVSTTSGDKYKLKWNCYESESGKLQKTNVTYQGRNDFLCSNKVMGVDCSAAPAPSENKTCSSSFKSKLTWADALKNNIENWKTGSSEYVYCISHQIPNGKKKDDLTYSCYSSISGEAVGCDVTYTAAQKIVCSLTPEYKPEYCFENRSGSATKPSQNNGSSR